MKATKKPATKKEASPKLSWTTDRLFDFVMNRLKKLFPLEPEQEEWRWIDDLGQEIRSAGESFISTKQEFDECCAFDVIGGFSLIPLRPRWTPDMRNAAIAYCIKADDAAPYVLATTIPKQRTVITVLKAIGFEAIKTVRNPNSGNQVTLWMASIGR